MARKKLITRDQILNAAYQLVASEGFSKFTARNIAAKIKCSTQPIYLEFENMDDLKNALFEKIEHRLKTEIFPKRHTGDFVIDLTLNYIKFAVMEKKLYRALYLDDYSEGIRVNQFTRNYFLENIEKDHKLNTLPDDKKQALLDGTWIVATGIASLASSGFIQPTEEEIILLQRDVVRSIVGSKTANILSY